MKRIQPIYFLVLCLLVFSACSNLSGLRSNAFEQRYPVGRCKGKVQVKDPDPGTIYGQYINPSKGIWLLDPYLTLKPPRYVDAQEDKDYIAKMHSLIVQRIRDKFEREQWVEGILPFDVEAQAGERRDTVINQMVSNAVKLDTINYGDWNVPQEFIRDDIPGYSLFLFIDGQVGFHQVTGHQNILYLFVIDNQTRKTTYADFMRYECDVRNLSGLDKILDYAYLKLLTLRFPPESEADDSP